CLTLICSSATCHLFRLSSMPRPPPRSTLFPYTRSSDLCTHTIIPDRIEAGTYAIAASAQGKEVIIDNVISLHIESLLAKLREMGVTIEESGEQLWIAPKDKLKSVDIKTLVYPGFPTDLQQPFTSLLTKAGQTGVVT